MISSITMVDNCSTFTELFYYQLTADLNIGFSNLVLDLKTVSNRVIPKKSYEDCY